MGQGRFSVHSKQEVHRHVIGRKQICFVASEIHQALSCRDVFITASLCQGDLPGVFLASLLTCMAT